MPRPKLFFISLLVLSVTAVFALTDSVVVSDAWISETPPGVNINAGYLVISNKGDTRLTLRKIHSPDYRKVEIHRSVMQGDNVKMELVPEVGIEAGGRLEFSPGALHLMLIDPGRAIRRGESVTLNLVFSNHGEISVTAEVRKLAMHHH